MKKKRIIASVTTILFNICVILVGILLLVNLEPVIYSDFFSNSEESISIYGLETKYVPQGLTYVEDKNVFLCSGYMNGNVSSSRIYVINENDEAKYLEVKNEDGSDFLGHVGGIATHLNKAYLACDNDEYNKIFELDLDEILNCEDGGSVKVINSYKLDVNPAFIYVYEDNFFVGEFYKEKSYETNPNHHLLTPSKEVNHALCYSYKASENGVDFNQVNYVLSIPDLVQGFTLTPNGKFVVSKSWAIASSTLGIYDKVLNYESTYKNHKLYYLCAKTLSKEVRMPPMSEELTYYKGMVLVNFESAGCKYKKVNLYRQTKILGYKLA